MDEDNRVEEIKNDHDLFWDGMDVNYVINYTTLSFKSFKPKLFVPCVYGYIFIHCVHFDHKKIEYVLLS